MLYPAIGIPMLRKGLLSRFGQFKYIRCLQRAGATIQMLVPGAASVDVGEAVSQCDGFLFPGGPDIQPDLYGLMAVRCFRIFGTNRNINILIFFTGLLLHIRSNLPRTAFWPSCLKLILFRSTACTIRLWIRLARGFSLLPAAQTGFWKPWSRKGTLFAWQYSGAPNIRQLALRRNGSYSGRLWMHAEGRDDGAHR